MKDPQTTKYRHRKGQSFSGFVRINLATIESEQEAGLPLETILADIRAETGFDRTFKGFKTALRRAREHVRKHPPRPPLTLPPNPFAGHHAHGVTLTRSGAPPVQRFMPAEPGQPTVEVVGGVPNALPVRRAFDFQPVRANDDMRELIGAANPGNPR